MRGDIEHPAVAIRRTMLLSCVGLLLLIRDLWKMRTLAGEAMQRERDMRARHAGELEDIDEQHLQRIRELSAVIAGQRAEFSKHKPEPDIEIAEAKVVDES